LAWSTVQLEEDKQIQKSLIEANKLPKHIAIIMDGNGRWAKNRNLPRVIGHKNGLDSVRDIVESSDQVGVKYLTLYAFSIENWKRPSMEVTFLMKLLRQYLENEIEELHRNNVKLNTIGKISSLPKNVRTVLNNCMEKTKENTGMVLTLALSYSGRWDIVRSVQMIVSDVRRGKVSPEDINEEFFSSYLQTNSLPNPDLLIRTSGEMRLSNFLLWELAYSELYVTENLWPDFRRYDLYKAIESFSKRERRFGMTSEQITDHTDQNKDTKGYIQRVLDAFNSR
jgi:undecaprenyl diphosphate synthase